ncbi:MAG TPA: heme ABC exporter ATP-binding protein CcmA [Methylocystis sp.]|nr:heme ABC exporter ATP-binding protein CcmA [Methylocystis sp.]
MREPVTTAARPHADMKPALRLRVESLCVERGGRRIITNASFGLAGGEALAVTGPNGAGKSTLLRALAGLLPIEAGTIVLEGAAESEVAPQAHYLAHADGLKAQLTVAENLEFWARYLALGDDARSLPIDAALDRLALGALADAPVAYLSAGQKRRAALARLLVAYRPLWLLDEPLTALDAASRGRFSEAMRDHCALGGVVVAATHEPLGLAGASFLALGKTPAESLS